MHLESEKLAWDLMLSRCDYKNHFLKCDTVHSGR